MRQVELSGKVLYVGVHVDNVGYIYGADNYCMYLYPLTDLFLSMALI